MKRSILTIALVALLVPAQAIAGVCFSIDGFTSIFLAVGPAAEGFAGLVGEAVSTCKLTNGSPSGESAPFTGSAHARANADAHFTLFVGGTASCFPISIQGTLLAPSYNSGSATVESLSTNGFAFVTLAPANCPALPS